MILTYAGTSAGAHDFDADPTLAFTTAGGAWTFTVDVAATVLIRGAGGGGGAGGTATVTNGTGGSGGGGASAIAGFSFALQPATTYAILVGAGGAAGAAGNDGADGNVTRFRIDAGTIFLDLGGGKKGLTGQATPFVPPGGAGGTSSIGGGVAGGTGGTGADGTIASLAGGAGVAGACGGGGGGGAGNTLGFAAGRGGAGGDASTAGMLGAAGAGGGVTGGTGGRGGGGWTSGTYGAGGGGAGGNGGVQGTAQAGSAGFIAFTAVAPIPPTPATASVASGSPGILVLPPFDLERIQQGDFLAIRDAFASISQVMNEFMLREQTPLQWIDVPYLATDYTVNGTGTWTVQSADLVKYKYTRIDDLCLIQLVIELSTTGAAGTYLDLYVKMPGGYQGAPGELATGVLYLESTGAGATEVGAIFVDGVTGPVNQLILRRLPFPTAWTANKANTINARGFIAFRIATGEVWIS